MEFTTVNQYYLERAQKLAVFFQNNILKELFVPGIKDIYYPFTKVVLIYSRMDAEKLKTIVTAILQDMSLLTRQHVQVVNIDNTPVALDGMNESSQTKYVLITRELPSSKKIESYLPFVEFTYWLKPMETEERKKYITKRFTDMRQNLLQMRTLDNVHRNICEDEELDELIEYICTLSNGAYMEEINSFVDRMYHNAVKFTAYNSLHVKFNNELIEESLYRYEGGIHIVPYPSLNKSNDAYSIANGEGPLEDDVVNQNVNLTNKKRKK